MATSAQTTSGEERLTGGKFYGSVIGKQAVGGAIFTELSHLQSRKLPAHSHELPFFCLFFRGDYQEKYGRRDVQFRPFTFSFRPAGVPHEDAIGPRGARMFGIEVEPAWRNKMQNCSGSLDVAYDFEGGEPLWLALKLYAETRTKLPPDDLQVESLISELLGRIACKPETNHIAPFWLRRIRDKLLTEFRRHITMDELGREAGVHPVHVSRVFRRHLGLGIGDYVHRLRIREACERLLDGEMSLADLSAELGFSDQSHFSRAFRNVTGTTPAAFRSMLAQQTIISPAGLHSASLSRYPFLSSAGLRL